MKNKKRNFNKFTPEISQLLFDIFFISIGVIFCFKYRFETFFNRLPFEVTSLDLLAIVVFLLIYFISLFWASGLYKNMYIVRPFEEIWKIIKSVFLGSFIIFILTFIDNKSMPRSFFLLYFVIITILVIIGRLLSRALHRFLRSKRLIAFKTIVIADVHNGIKILDQLKSSPAWGLSPYGYIYIDKLQYLNNKDENLGEFPVLGHVEFLPEIVDTFKPKQIIICDESKNHNLLFNIAAFCAKNKIKVKIPPSLYDVFTGQSRANSLYGIPFISIDTELFKPWEEITKRILDVVLSSLILVLGFPFWALLALFVKLDSSGKVFYTQKRVGKDGKIFDIYKFRSMVTNAEKIGSAWTLPDDKRVTKFGRFIRKSHLDEVPQFWNVLIGDMSVVGPRPEQPSIVDKYIKILPIYERRLLVRPGITGWWQINYKPHIESLEEIKSRLKDDFYYIENMSIKFDLEIIFRTIFVVLKGHGQA